ncbi:F0F1 ATP synthase subunit gamma [bacterium]|nr:F0F1 ATP synthase subunit gamma [bacterium]
MATLRDIKKRIGAVRNIEQITRAMKMVAAAKLRKAQERILAARPYARHLKNVIADVAARVPADAHPLLRANPEGRGTVVLVVTADRGLCGSFNANILRRSRRFLQEECDGSPAGGSAVHGSAEGGDGAVRGAAAQVFLAGRKAVSYFKVHYPPGQSAGVETIGSIQDFYRSLDFSHGAKVAGELVDFYLARHPTSLYVIYNEFKSAIAQRVVVEKLLPFTPTQLPPTHRSEFIYEPADPDFLLTRLIRLDLEVQLYTIFLESFSAEQAARMTAMENAADNAVDLNSRLTLVYNRTRQAGITKEIAEIVGGAEALK